jgi:geranylgeranyl reductase family protein
MKHTDVIIVGGGPAGATCAAKLKQGGAEVIVLDKQKFPRIKPCAGWVTPRVWLNLGIELAEYPFQLMKFNALHVTFGNFYFKFRTRQYAIRRIEFDEWLLQRSGAPIYQYPVNQIAKTNGAFTIDNEFNAKYLVGAGGTSCPVRRNLFGEVGIQDRGPMIAALEEEFEYPFQDQKCRLWFFQNHLPGYSWLVPKANGWVNIGIGALASSLNQRGIYLQEYWQQYVLMLVRKKLIKGHSYKPLGYSYFLRSEKTDVQKGNVFLIGDSAGLATRDLGEGIGPAIESGILAADSILHGTPYNLRSIPKYSFPPSDIIRSLWKPPEDPQFFNIESTSNK